jgi:hypothetical protein
MAPKRRQCGAMQEYERLLEQSPSFRTNQRRAENFTLRALTSGEADRVARKLITIPTVIHVVHKKPSENIPRAQILSQITALNKDFRSANPDVSKVPPAWKGLVGDPKIKFQLAKVDPHGKPTTGVVRVKTAAWGGTTAWATDRYLNIWVCTLRDGLLGYAQFPGGPKATDGVVILNTAFGTQGTAAAPFNLGRTATHEVGHWLNLRHIWGDTLDCSGGDLVADTPNCAGPNIGKPKFPKLSCSNGPHGDMFMNYMDYVDDAAMFMFTAGQVARMSACLAGPRKTFVAAPAR